MHIEYSFTSASLVHFPNFLGQGFSYFYGYADSRDTGYWGSFKLFKTRNLDIVIFIGYESFETQCWKRPDPTRSRSYFTDPDPI